MPAAGACEVVLGVNHEATACQYLVARSLLSPAKAIGADERCFSRCKVNRGLGWIASVSMAARIKYVSPVCAPRVFDVTTPFLQRRTV